VGCAGVLDEFLGVGRRVGSSDAGKLGIFPSAKNPTVATGALIFNLHVLATKKDRMRKDGSIFASESVVSIAQRWEDVKGRDLWQSLLESFNSKACEAFEK
jgi:hypothetical protein